MTRTAEGQRCDLQCSMAWSSRRIAGGVTGGAGLTAGTVRPRERAGAGGSNLEASAAGHHPQPGRGREWGPKHRKTARHDRSALYYSLCAQRRGRDGQVARAAHLQTSSVCTTVLRSRCWRMRADWSWPAPATPATESPGGQNGRPTGWAAARRLGSRPAVRRPDRGSATPSGPAEATDRQGPEDRDDQDRPEQCVGDGVLEGPGCWLAGDGGDVTEQFPGGLGPRRGRG